METLRAINEIQGNAFTGTYSMVNKKRWGVFVWVDSS